MPVTRSLLIAVGVLGGGFLAYSRFSRPDVPTPVAKTLEHFAPGVAIATSVEQSGKRVSGLHWVDGRGWVGKPAAPYADEVRLFPRRGKGDPGSDRNASVESVELVAFHDDALKSTLRNLAITFDTNLVEEGCLDPVGDGYPYRQVRYFTTKHDRGGAAIINDWVTKPRVWNDTVTLHPWSIVLWTGKFAGASTLHGSYKRASCKDLAGTG
jgi:hypothetical protein